MVPMVCMVRLCRRHAVWDLRLRCLFSGAADCRTSLASLDDESSNRMSFGAITNSGYIVAAA